MQYHMLHVGEELVIEGRARLTVLEVDEDEVFLGITAEPKDEQSQVVLPSRLLLMRPMEA